MDMPLTLTKILMPRRPASLLTRERLLDLLYDLLEYRLIIIAAPAGYGKTSLLVDLAHHVEMPVCWYTLDALDQDPRRFVAHLIASIAQCFPDFGKQSFATLQGAASPGLAVDLLVQAIVNEAYEHIREHFVLVLDDYHLVGESEPINRFISQFTQAADENCHLILSSRTLLSLPDLPLMVARSQVGGLAFGDLAFRAEEIQALMLQNYHLKMPTGEAERLAQETEGWITGLLLSAQTMWQGMADQVRLARASGVGLYDYLAQQVLDQQPTPVRDFLLCTSLLEEFDVKLCQAVLGSDKDWPGLIDAVLRSNLFVLPVDSENTWLRYHHLFRDFLQTRLAQENPEKRERILRRLAAVYAQRREWEKARDIYRRLGDVAATADLIEQAGPSLVKSGQWVTLTSWIDTLPSDVLTSRPALLSRRGVAAVMLGEVKQGLSLLDQAVIAFRTESNAARLAGTLIWRATAHRYRANYQASLADADEALALTAQDERLRAVRAEAFRVRGLCLRRLGRLREAIDCLEQSKTLYGALGDEEDAAMVSVDLGMAFRATGDYQRAESTYNNALDYWRKMGDAAHQASVLNNLGVLSHFRGNYEQAGSLLEEALACARRSGFARIEALALSSIGDLYADLEALEAAQEAYHQARQIAQRIEDRFLLLYLDLAEAALARSKSELARAHSLLESARQMAEASDSKYEQGLCHLEAGRQSLAKGNTAEATAQLEKATCYFDESDQRVESARAHLCLAAIYEANGAEQAAFAHLLRALDQTTNLKNLHGLVVVGQEAKPLLKAAQGKPALCFQAAQLLQQVAQFEQATPSLRRSLRRQAAAVPIAPPRLTFQALGSAQATVGGRQVTGADWQSLAARDLLFCLLAHPEGLTKEEVGVIFWPDHSPAQLRLQFKQTVYRLRRALGQDVVLFDKDRYCFNRAMDYEYDVDAFMERLGQAQTAATPTERAAAYRAAIHLYKGDFMPEIDGIWVEPERERLRRAFIEALLAMAESSLETQEYKAALDYCQRALTLDPCLEEAHRLAMRIHAATSNRVGVVRQLEHCRQALQEEMGIPPSPQTRSLYESLIH